MSERPPVVLIASTSWHLHNFRAGLIRALKNQGHDVVCIAPADANSGDLVAQGVSFVPWTLDLNGTSPWREFQSCVALWRILRRLRPGFVYTFTIKPNIYAGLACRLLGISYANTVTGLGMLIGRRSMLARLVGHLYRLSNRGTARLYAQNPDDLATLRRLGLVDATPIVEVPGSGVDTERFAAQPTPAPPMLFLMMARLQREKGVEDFVAAARRLRATLPGARFVLLGSSRFANRSAIPPETLASWRAENIVELPGEATDVRPWLASAHAVVLPSHGGEGMPRSLLEAASSARPVIASDVPGCRQSVVDGITGFLHSPRDVAALADAMLRFARLDPERRMAMGKAARQLAETRFSERLVVAAYLDALAGEPSRRVEAA